MELYGAGLTAGAVVGSGAAPRRLDLVVEARSEDHAIEQVMAAWRALYREAPLNLVGGVRRV